MDRLSVLAASARAVQQNLNIPQQRLQVIRNGAPNDGGVDHVVAVDQDIAKRDDAAVIGDTGNGVLTKSAALRMSSSS